ncbi:hypothetical protein [Paracoccus marcusii]|uniref:hypothetical protein n=1 Tax=Paracoccus marcusii TaxID=59779 RepID=UPI002493274F|nr:hypothetical protein [Paracoccus marcusii]
MLKIEGPRPAVDLQVKNYTLDMAACADCVSWITLDLPDMELLDGHVCSVRPRVGTVPLTAPAFSRGPLPGKWEGMVCADHVRDTLDYLYLADVPLDAENFSLASVVAAETGVKPFQNLMALAASGPSLRLVKHEGLFSIRMQNDEIVNSEPDWRAAGPYLVIMSASGGQVRLRISDRVRKGAVHEAAYTSALTGPLNVVLGADQVAFEPDRPTPSTPRGWRGQSMELWVFDTDILAEVNASPLAMVGQYFSKTYGGVE